MKIEPTSVVNTRLQADSLKLTDQVNKTLKKHTVSDPYIEAETKHTLDTATGLLQTIITDKLSDQVIRKIPTDEYLHLLSLLDEIISGSIDKHV
jgi:uncharacterized FlaG/YvyC family protein